MKKRKFKVVLEFRYSDTVHVEAEDEREAEQLALSEAEPMYEAHVDSRVVEE